MARLLYLVRHGETEWNRAGRWQGNTDTALSDVGRSQARALAVRLRGLGIEAVLTSDLERARETAEIVATELGLPAPRLDARLRERGFGCFEGLTRDQCCERFPDAWRRYHDDRRWTPPGAEVHEDVVARMIAAMHEIARSLPDGAAALVVSHGGTMRSFVHAITGAPPPPIGNGALMRARFERGRFTEVDPPEGGA